MGQLALPNDYPEVRPRHGAKATFWLVVRISIAIACSIHIATAADKRDTARTRVLGSTRVDVPATQPTHGSEDRYAILRQMIRRASDSQIEWSDLDRDVRPDGTVGRWYGFHAELQGPAAEAQRVCLGFKGDGAVLRAVVIPELLAALDDPEQFAVAHLILLQLFRPDEAGRLTPAGRDAFVWTNDGLRVHVRVLHRSGTGYNGDDRIETYSVSAKIDRSTAAALAQQWSKRHEQGQLLGHF